MKQSYQAFVKTLKSDEEKLNSNEARIRKLEELFPKVDAMKSSLMTTQLMQNDVEGLKIFVERSLPMLTHIQLCEGLNIVAGEYMPEVTVFQKEKMKEI